MNQKLTPVQYDEHVNEGITEGDNILTDTTKYQRLVGRLLVVRYIKEAPGLGLLIPAEDTTKLTAYYDSDWGACVETRRSIIGYLVKFGEGLIFWKSKKQETGSRSSAEAEFRSMTACTTDMRK
ncbi:secreted RxLR effector protein 161-like [Solanum stenotomum]|uniref:secreted RxLR effector protein 161-like n=1 Tax=Solanum stenotomum TaxID=172797 RepID=UPI0020CFEE87|nr:secreted RxLR effector protein 161-like [Solanum stenotomum]